MKKSVFKTLSILLAAVLLVAALPITAFAEDVSPCAPPVCEHNYEEEFWYDYEYVTNEYHLAILFYSKECTICGDLAAYGNDIGQPESHSFDYDIVDPEVDMEGECVDCGGTIYW